jgi:predicted acetylornithine/succinylornithine family transaminase
MTTPAGHVGPISHAKLVELGKEHLFGTYRQPPAVMVRGEGPFLFDDDGKRYVDFSGGLTVNSVGHAHPKLSAAIAEQARTLGHVSNLFYNDKTVRLAGAICERSFGDRVFFSNSGAEANEAAIKLARRYFFDKKEDRFEIVSMEHSFHGRTMGALTATGQPKYHEGFAPLVPGFKYVPYGDIGRLREAVGPKTAMVMMEPIQGEGGVILPPAGYLRAVRELCDERGCLLHFDEVQVGMGRTGTWFCHQRDGVVPDTMSLAKALGGGLPLGALVAKNDKAACLVPGTHASTFGGNPIACAAGLAFIALVDEEDLLTRCNEVGARAMARLRAGLAGAPILSEVRGRGSLIAVQLTRPARDFLEVGRQRGLLFSIIADTVIRLAPPFNIPYDVLDEGIDGMIDLLKGG